MDFIPRLESATVWVYVCVSSRQRITVSWRLNWFYFVCLFYFIFRGQGKRIKVDFEVHFIWFWGIFYFLFFLYWGIFYFIFRGQGKRIKVEAYRFNLIAWYLSHRVPINKTPSLRPTTVETKVQVFRYHWYRQKEWQVLRYQGIEAVMNCGTHIETHIGTHIGTH
jgi:hypothetical protein